MKSAAKRQFDGWADSYDRFLLKGIFFEPAYRALLQEVVRWRSPESGPFRVLDIGCGTGTLVHLLAGSSLPAEVTGLDFTPSMIRQAREKMEKFELSDHCRFICGDAEHLPVASGAYDLVTCCHSFHHYPHQDGAVREMRRVLRPGGRLMLVDGFRDNVIGWFLYDVCVATFERAVHHAAWSALRAMFQQAGLRDVQHRKFNWWAPQILITGMA